MTNFPANNCVMVYASHDDQSVMNLETELSKVNTYDINDTPIRKAML